MRFVSRAQWGARPPRDTTRIDPATEGVTIHWEGPGVGVLPHDRCAARARGIQGFHMGLRQWADIAYTALVCQHGYVFEGRGVGVRSAANGTDSGNRSWYAVCAMAGVGDPLTPELLTGLDDAIDWLRAHGAGQHVNAHRDHKPTTCPGDALTAWAHGPHDPPRKGALMALSDIEQAELLDLVRRSTPDRVWSYPLEHRTVKAPAIVVLVDALLSAQASARDSAVRSTEPAVIASHLADALGPDLVRAVTDELARRLKE